MAEQKSFSLTMNVSKVAARQGVGGGYAEPATGAYKVSITEVVLYQKDDGKSSVRFQTVFTEGEFAGSEQRLYIGTDLSKAGNLRSWKTALLSAGYTAAQIENGEVDITPETFAGREAFIYYKAKDANDPTSQPDRQFITPESFATLTGETAKAEQAPAAKVAAPAAAKVAAPAAAVAPKPGGAQNLRSLLGK